MKPWIPRRLFLTGAVAAAGIAALAGGYEVFLFRSRPKGPYGDVLASLDDFSDAPVLGRAYLAQTKNFDAKAVAAQLRARLQHQSFSGMLNADVAGNQVAEAGGWVLPESLALLCALAAVNK